MFPAQGIRGWESIIPGRRILPGSSVVQAASHQGEACRQAKIWVLQWAAHV